MKRFIQCLALLLLTALVSCATRQVPSAEIRVFVGYPPQPDKLDGIHLMTQKSILSSHDFARHLEQKFSLSQKWKMTPEDACAKIMNTISVDVGGDAGRYVVELPGLEHKQAVELLNDLCEYYSQKGNLVGLDENSNPQTMTVTIFRRAY
jgi:hypothetical protein